MEQPNVPHRRPNVPDSGITYELEKRYSKLVPKITSGQVQTFSMPEDRLPSYLRAASATGFKVEQIAVEREKFPDLLPYSDSFGNLHPEKIFYIRVEGEGYIAVSVERPKGSKDHTPFWDALKSLEQKKA